MANRRSNDSLEIVGPTWRLGVRGTVPVIGVVIVVIVIVITHML